jgi:hypothetical protein
MPYLQEKSGHGDALSTKVVVVAASLCGGKRFVRDGGDKIEPNGP